MNSLQNLIKLAGGYTNGRYVLSHGIVVLSDDNGITEKAETIFDSLHISRDQNPFFRLSEFTARITYLSFPRSAEYNPALYHKKLSELGHTSPYNLKPIAVLVAGLSIEMVLEIVSGKANRSGRLTSSDTKAMSDTMYYVGEGPDKDTIINFTESFLTLRETLSSDLTLMTRNQLNLSHKASAIVVSMNKEEWQKLLEGRLHPDTHTEAEYRLILERIKTLLHL